MHKEARLTSFRSNTINKLSDRFHKMPIIGESGKGLVQGAISESRRLTDLSTRHFEVLQFTTATLKITGISEIRKSKKFSRNIQMTFRFKLYLVTLVVEDFQNIEVRATCLFLQKYSYVLQEGQLWIHNNT